MNATSRCPSTSPPSPGTQHVFYLYCIIETGTQAHRLLDESLIPGLEPNEPLFPIEAAGLVAAVSRVPGAVFQDEPFNQLLTELPRLAPVALKHNEAIQALLPFAPGIVPISLGAVYRSPQRIASLLRDRAEAFRTLLAALRGKREWGVRVLRDRARLLEAVESTSAELCRLAQTAAQSSPGRAYLVRKQRERLLVEEAERLERQSLEAIRQRLTQASSAVHADQLPDPPPGAVSLAMKVSFLVELRATEAFQSVAAELERSLAPLGFQLELNGPWAPYSFVRGRLGTGPEDDPCKMLN